MSEFNQDNEELRRLRELHEQQGPAQEFIDQQLARAERRHNSQEVRSDKDAGFTPDIPGITRPEIPQAPQTHEQPKMTLAELNKSLGSSLDRILNDKETFDPSSVTDQIEQWQDSDNKAA